MQLREDPPAAGGRQHMHDLAVAHQGRLIVPLHLHSRLSILTRAHGAQRCGTVLLSFAEERHAKLRRKQKGIQIKS